jgi:hypothetical protein
MVNNAAREMLIKHLLRSRRFLFGGSAAYQKADKKSAKDQGTARWPITFFTPNSQGWGRRSRGPRRWMMVYLQRP